MVVDDMTVGVVEDREGSIWLVFVDGVSEVVEFSGRVVAEFFDPGVDRIVAVVVEMGDFTVVGDNKPVLFVVVSVEAVDWIVVDCRISLVVELTVDALFAGVNSSVVT